MSTQAARYLDKEDFENELKQVLGDTHVAYDLGREGEGLMVMGSQGILLVQPDALSGSSVEQTLAGYHTIFRDQNRGSG
eukprot:COSAG01_NODE_7489_length_3188_cov_1.910651_2_plen_79_part_00